MKPNTPESQRMVDLMAAVYGYRYAGKPVPVEHPFEWINAFSIDELRDLLTEADGDFHRALDGEISWDDFEAVLHEWQESAIALRSQPLVDAFSASTDEVPLTDPALEQDVEG